MERTNTVLWCFVYWFCPLSTQFAIIRGGCHSDNIFLWHDAAFVLDIQQPTSQNSKFSGGEVGNFGSYIWFSPVSVVDFDPDIRKILFVLPQWKNLRYFELEDVLADGAVDRQEFQYLTCAYLCSMFICLFIVLQCVLFTICNPMEAHYKVHTIYSIGMVEEGSIVVKQNKHRTYIMSIHLSIYLYIYIYICA